MKTVVLDPRPAEIDALVERRHALGQDLFDEIWEGEYHMVPAPRPAHGYVETQLAELLGPCTRAAGLVGLGPFNLGSPDDYRVPDRGYHRALPTAMFVPTAALVVEVISPDDETSGKFDFYARQGVEELLIADPDARELTFWHLAGGSYERSPESALLGVSAADLAARIDWP